MEMTIFQKVSRLKLILTQYATGQSIDENEFIGLRTEVTKNAFLRRKLPHFVIECRTLREYWTFIQTQSTTYKGRRAFLQSQFQDLLQELEFEPEAALETPSFKEIDRPYIIELTARAMYDVQEGNYDSAITKSRTLLEEVFCYVIEKRGDSPTESGNIASLYSQVKQLYNMHQHKDIDKRINTLLSGLEKILSSISEMRNKDSDAHGVGARRKKIAEHHARLFVNAAMTMADFVLAVYQNSEIKADAASTCAVK